MSKYIYLQSVMTNLDLSFQMLDVSNTHQTLI